MAFRHQDLIEFATRLLSCAGLDADKAGTVAEVLVGGCAMGSLSMTSYVVC